MVVEIQLDLDRLRGSREDQERRQVQNLEQRLNDLERGQVSLQAAREEVPQVCPMCQRMMESMSQTPGRDEVEQRLQGQVRRLEQRVQALEQRSA